MQLLSTQQPLLFSVLSIHFCVSSIQTATDPDDDSQLIVELPIGKIRGKFNGDFYSYESIPYAQPPVGDLRFEPPKPYTETCEGIRDATQEPTPCMQWDQNIENENKLHGSEDCLTISVYKPSMTTASNTLLPVLILIHGGAFMFGNAAANDAQYVLRRKHFIVVKMNYRLGPLGFLSTEDAVIPGNFGLKDQLLALQWTKANIARFGGDPERMFVLGFSSAGAAVHLHMLRKNFNELAKVAASLSGTALCPWAIQRKPRARAIELAQSLQCPNTESSVEIKRCLQSKDATEIVSAVRNFLIFGYNPFTTFGPVIEAADVVGAFLQDEPANIIRSGEFAQLPWLASYSAQDGGYNAAALLQPLSENGDTTMLEDLNEHWLDLAPYALYFKDNFSSTVDLDEHSRMLKEEYLGDKNFSMETYFDLQRMYTDVLFKNRIEQAVRLHAEYSKYPVYAYKYDYPAVEDIATGLSNRKDIQFGSVHGNDFFLIFYTAIRLPQLSNDEEIMSNDLIQMLENFLDNSADLKFRSCKFWKNTEKSQIHLMQITKDKCDTIIE